LGVGLCTLLCAGGVGGAFGLVVFLSRYLYLLG